MGTKEKLNKAGEIFGAVIAAIAKFIGDRFGNPNPVYPKGSIQSIEDNPTPIPGNEFE